MVQDFPSDGAGDLLAYLAGQPDERLTVSSSLTLMRYVFLLMSFKCYAHVFGALACL